MADYTDAEQEEATILLRRIKTKRDQIYYNLHPGHITSEEFRFLDRAANSMGRDIHALEVLLSLDAVSVVDKD